MFPSEAKNGFYHPVSAAFDINEWKMHCSKHHCRSIQWFKHLCPKVTDFLQRCLFPVNMLEIDLNSFYSLVQQSRFLGGVFAYFIASYPRSWFQSCKGKSDLCHGHFCFSIILYLMSSVATFSATRSMNIGVHRGEMLG